MMSTEIAQNVDTKMLMMMQKFSQTLSKTFANVAADQVMTMWTDMFHSSENIFSMVKTSNMGLSSTPLCSYVYTKGDNYGRKCQNRCLSGSSYCQTHDIFKSPAVKLPDAVPAPTHVNEEDLISPRVHAVSPLRFKCRYSAEIQNFFIEGYNYVVKSASTSPSEPYTIKFPMSQKTVIIGKKNGNKIVPLINEDVKNLLKWGMDYHPINPSWNKMFTFSEEVDSSLVETTDDLPHSSKTPPKLQRKRKQATPSADEEETQPSENLKESTKKQKLASTPSVSENPTATTKKRKTASKSSLEKETSDVTPSSREKPSAKKQKTTSKTQTNQDFVVIDSATSTTSKEPAENCFVFFDDDDFDDVTTPAKEFPMPTTKTSPQNPDDLDQLFPISIDY